MAEENISSSSVSREGWGEDDISLFLIDIDLPTNLFIFSILTYSMDNVHVYL